MPELWEIAAKHPIGRPRLYADEGELWAACLDYFEWASTEFIREPRTTFDEGREIVSTVATKVRPFSITGLCVFLGMSEETWRSRYRTKEEFVGVISQAEQIIKDQKMAGAHVGLFNANLVSREYGLSDNVKVKQEGTLRVGKIEDDSQSDDAVKALVETTQSAGALILEDKSGEE